VDVYYCDRFELKLPPGHSFPMAKYRLLRERVTTAEFPGLNLITPERASDADVLAVHCPDYVDRVMHGGLSEAEQRKIGFPWSPEVAERSRRVSGATIGAVLSAVRDGVAVTLAGGTHHAKFSSGAGYCLFNDSVIAARHAQRHGLAQTIVVIDLDVHQGDGTALLTANDPSIYTFSMHAAKAFPAVKPASDRDIALPDGCDDDTYLAALGDALPEVLDAARADLAIYLAGADPYRDDRLGRLGLSPSALRRRDAYVIASVRERGLPIAISMAGGYAHSVDDIVAIHFATVTEAHARWRRERC
jgi:acetoin utilization deacetylase AcuC-like enzyme